jgi:myo-inositol-1(or 4)-monophosphatase
MGSVAYKLALVSAGLADITFTLSPKNEWDVTAGAALVLSSGGFVTTLENTQFDANNKNPLLSGLIAGGPSCSRSSNPILRQQRRNLGNDR